MAKMKLRDELKRPDEFISFFGQVAKALLARRREVIWSLIGVVLLGAAWVGWQMHRDGVNKRAADALFGIIDQLPTNTPAVAKEAPPKDQRTWKEVVTELDGFLKEHGVSDLAATAHLYRGRAYLRLQKPEQALTAYREAGDRLGGPYQYLAEEGEALALMQLQRWEEAEKIWRSLAMADDNPFQDLHTWNLGLTLEGKKATAEAINTYQGFEETFSNSPYLEDVRTRLLALRQGG